jgi:hypothetical protein
LSAAWPTAVVALSAALLIASAGAVFDDEFVRFREELGFREFDGLRLLDDAFVLALV